MAFIISLEYNVVSHTKYLLYYTYHYFRIMFTYKKIQFNKEVSTRRLTDCWFTIKRWPTTLTINFYKKKVLNSDNRFITLKILLKSENTIWYDHWATSIKTGLSTYKVVNLYLIKVQMYLQSQIKKYNLIYLLPMVHHASLFLIKTF